ncbi:dipeptide/oligopeptide/nickel ABC transporter ATP-binding protein [Pseudoroseomonas cervicalis]|uniref:ABC transporter ATP-binding protein n=1 Tax=Teichococcus cervicalis TaxID=204525 RepID=UPI0022F1CF24|nr:dipeptide/oligopeptide/nickel ABC transporter ATP-binding protein [Pseudoroseomonas cervicalis]WBV45227.1 dipeptide/oligopeptide/nickel ABC transporter ATP-binding protein [Pseudoroseomonas cervicalis]
MTPLLEARGLRHAYRQGGLWARRHVPVLEDAALSIAPGECVALLGPTGSGKSTLGRLLLGLEAPDAGEIFFQGTPLRDARGRIAPERRRALQAVFQDPFGATSPRLSAFEVVAEPLLAERLDAATLRARVTALLRQVGLEAGLLDRLAHRLSGGQLQRLCIARALAPAPRLVVLDEAVNSLDLETQARILDLLRGLRRQGGTAFLFITHDLRLLRGFADRCYVMQDRRAIAVDDPFGTATPPPVLAALRAAILPARPSPARLRGS